MVTPLSDAQRVRLAHEVRKRFVAEAGRAMAELAAAANERLTALMHEAATSRVMQHRQDIWTLYQSKRNQWVEATVKEWQAALQPSAMVSYQDSQIGLELLGTDVVENQILASRLAMAVMGKGEAEVTDLRLRMKYLEGTPDTESRDILQPEALLLLMIEQWVGAGLPREAWPLVHDVVQKLLTERLPQAYAHGNEFLIEQGVLPTIELKNHFKRAAPADSRAMKASAPATPAAAATPSAARGHGRAEGVLSNLKRLLMGVGGANLSPVAYRGPSPALAAALSVRPAAPGGPGGGATAFEDEDSSPASVMRVASALREKTAELKNKAQTNSEKATIEIVALMFQSILQEDRIPPGMRVWFARLQMPVLRVALAEPDFFGTLNHPARQLIDRMGSCVMGFDASGINGSALETEIKRVVQVIEQYPETGKRVYQLVYDEFQTFLAKFLTGKASTQNLVSVAQQVEQKETLTIQYTIEMRNMLKDLAVRDEIREFLFKVWAEVLAMAAVRHGPQDAQTLELKKTVTDLVWATSAKPNRKDRARVIKDWPQLVQKLRVGMTLLGVTASKQDAHVKAVSATLAEAFVSKTQAIPSEQIQAMAERLERLEDFVSDDGMAELPLDAESIEMMLGLDAVSIDVVTDGGSQPTPAMLAWAQELPLGAWFTLDHNGRMAQVQFVWRSDRKHLNLFAATDGHSYLLQTGRLAAYLHAGLLLPHEEETLTERATRDALVKLEANPERLLS
jgi:hypothetical protein